MKPTLRRCLFLLAVMQAFKLHGVVELLAEVGPAIQIQDQEATRFVIPGALQLLPAESLQHSLP